jgi:5'(3')-deoxyribonucleotidase
MVKPRTLLDLDGVMYDFQGAATYLLNTQFGYELTRNWPYWDFPKAQVSKEAWEWLWAEGVTEKGVFRHGNLIKGAITGVQELGKISHLLIATSRPENARSDTWSWIAHHWDLPVSGIVLVNDGSWFNRKSDIGADVFIDDGPHNAMDVLEHTNALMLLVTRPWNEEMRTVFSKNPVPRLKVVNSWTEIYDAVSTYAMEAKNDRSRA